VTGDQPRELRLTWRVDQDTRAELEEEIFGKNVLITGHDDWPTAEVVAGYRSQSEAEFGFRQLKDRHVVSFSPMHHWTKHNIRVHVFTCALALQLAHLMRYRARQHGLNLSVRELLSQLAHIQETVLIYPSTGGRPKARRMTTELTVAAQHRHEHRKHRRQPVARRRPQHRPTGHQCGDDPWAIPRAPTASAP
jgi:hypothetical protein